MVEGIRVDTKLSLDNLLISSIYYLSQFSLPRFKTSNYLNTLITFVYKIESQSSGQEQTMPSTRPGFGGSFWLVR